MKEVIVVLLVAKGEREGFELEVDVCQIANNVFLPSQAC
jgi:hypothetical protein